MNQLGPAIESFVVPPAVLTVEGLSFSCSGRALFSNVSKRICAGVTLIRGGDGRGKTTLLRLLAGSLPADSGVVQRTPSAQPADTNQIFWMDPRTQACDEMSLRAYLESVKTKFAGFDSQTLDVLMDGLSLKAHADKLLYMLSTGSKRKVWIAAAVASGAQVILIDDPFAALDKPSIRFITELLQQASKQSTRAWVISGFDVPEGVNLAQVIDLGD